MAESETGPPAEAPSPAAPIGAVPPPAPAPEADRGIETLRRVREEETRWDERLEAAKREGEQSLARLREETEEAIQAARRNAEHARDETLRRTRADADREAERILADGRRAAEIVERLPPKESDKLRPEILSAVLGEFASG